MKFDKIKGVRLNQQTEKKADELQEKHPDIYRNFSDVARAGIHQLHKQKILKGGKNF